MEGCHFRFPTTCTAPAVTPFLSSPATYAFSIVWPNRARSPPVVHRCNNFEYFTVYRSLLSPDGGGIRGLSPLLMLKEILHRIQQKRRLQELPRPCDIFDLAGGTSTGGYVVVITISMLN